MLSNDVETLELERGIWIDGYNLLLGRKRSVQCINTKIHVIPHPIIGAFISRSFHLRKLDCLGNCHLMCKMVILQSNAK